MTSSIISITGSSLLSAMNVRAGLTGAATATTAKTSSSAAKTPKAPWVPEPLPKTATTTAAKAIATKAAAAAITAAGTAEGVLALVNNLLSGGTLVDPSSAKLDVKTGSTKTNSDYQGLFAVYNALHQLSNLASASQDSTATDWEKTRIQQAFSVGLAQVKAYVAQNPFNAFTLTAGIASSTDTATAVQPGETDIYAGATVGTGTTSTTPSRLAGPLAFTMVVKSSGYPAKTVSYDLSEMGATPRTLPNVANYLNAKLKADGFQSRFAVTQTPGPTVMDSKGATVAGPSLLSLKINGRSNEQLSFSDPAATPAVYLAQTAGVTADARGSTPATTAQIQLLKLNADPSQPADANAQLFKSKLSAATAAARAVATGSDGSVYLLSDTTGPTPDGQKIDGAQDAVLTKYDPAGNVVFTRTLGASGSASGYALALSPDGASVAVASSVTGGLDANATPTKATAADTTVTVYDTTLGHEKWTTRTGAPGGDDSPTAIAFGADGAVYVTGQTKAPLNGVTGQVSASDNYLIGFAGNGAKTFGVQYGAAIGNHAAGVAVVDGMVVVAGMENGHAVLRSFQPTAKGVTAGTVRDLGDLQGGDIAGLTVGGDGRLVVAGSTHNSALNVATTVAGSDGKRDVFVARISGDLSASASDTIAYVGQGADASTSGVTVANGVVYVAGALVGATPKGKTTPNHQGFVAAINPDSGQIVWSRKLDGQDGQDAPTGVAVSATGATSLDKLGLPSGAIRWGQTDRIVDFSSVRPGYSFFVTSSAGRRSITIDAAETFATMAQKINTATAFTSNAQSVYAFTGQSLTIAPANNFASISLEAGPAGADALSALGIAPGVISSAADNSTKTVTPKSNIKVAPYALGLTASLTVDTATNAKAATSSIADAISKIQAIYSDVSVPRDPNAPTVKGNSRPVPAYLTAQLANYKAGLARLNNGTTSNASAATSLLG